MSKSTDTYPIALEEELKIKVASSSHIVGNAWISNNENDNTYTPTASAGFSRTNHEHDVANHDKSSHNNSFSSHPDNKQV